MIEEEIGALVATQKELTARIAALERKPQMRQLLQRTDPTMALGTDLHDLGGVQAAKMRQDVAQNITTSNWTTITMDSILFDSAGDAIDLTNNHIVINRSGFYLIMGRVSFAVNATGGRFIGFSKNSATSPTSSHHGFGNTGASNLRVSAPDCLELLVGDTLELKGWQNGANPLATHVTVEGDRSFLAVVLLASS